jgi:hypothetical protein
MSIRLRSPLVLPGLLLLTACGGGGGGGSPAPTLGNLSVTGVELVSSDPHAAHEMRLRVALTATQAYADVPVAYVLLNRADVDAAEDEVRQHQVSTSVIGTVVPGPQTHEVVVTIPQEVREANDWYLVPHLDPADVIAETDETDNEPTDGSKIPVGVGSGNTDLHDIVLESVSIEQDAVILWESDPTIGRPLEFTDPRNQGNRQSAQDRSNHDFDATLEVTTTGTREVQSLDVTASIALPGVGDLALAFWDPDRSRYSNQVLTPVTPGVPTTVNMDVHIPTDTRSRLRTYLGAGLPNVFVVTFSSNMTAGIREWEGGNERHAGRQTASDNQITAELVIMLPPDGGPNPCNDLAYEAGYRKDWENSTFGLGVDFGAGASLDRRGAIGQAHAAIPVRLFGAASNAVDLRAFGRVLPRANQPTDAEFSVDFSMFGVSLFSRRSIDPSVTYTKEETFTRTREVRGRVFAGPIPIRLVARSTGTLGYSLLAYLDAAQMRVEGQAFGRIEAFASASVDAVVIEAGVAGSITLLDDVFTARASCALGTPGGGQISGTLQLQAVNQLTGPNGRIYVYEAHTEPKWCYRVVPCGLRRVRNEKTLARFRSFTKTDVLFDLTEERTVCLQ